MHYVRFPLSLRNVEDILRERGIDISHETVRYWWDKFGPLLAKEIRKKHTPRAYSNWRWHMDEVFVKINGKTHYLWRAVDHEGAVLDCYVSRYRNKSAALRFIKKLLKNYGKPRELVTDKLRSYGAALSALNLHHIHETSRYSNNRAENSHLHFRRKERSIYRFRQARTLQKFITIQGTFQNHFNSQRHLLNRENFKTSRDISLQQWQQFAVA